MQLLVAVINDPGKLDEILAGLLQLGVRGATVITSEGMGMRLAYDIPLFARLQIPSARVRPENRTILSVVHEEQVEPVMTLLQRVCGDLSDPGTGIAFSVPIDRLIGLAPPLTEGSAG
jgi:nitrogen regulatory protein PII